jgi:hypothetical protein
MFDNIGEKIKKLAVVLTVLGIIGSIIFAIILWANELIGAGFLALFVGILSSWVGSFLLYGFGELIDNTKEMSNNTKIQTIVLLKEASENTKNQDNKTIKTAINLFNEYNNDIQFSIKNNKTRENSEKSQDTINTAKNSECPTCFAKITNEDKECPFCGYILKD